MPVGGTMVAEPVVAPKAVLPPGRLSAEPQLDPAGMPLLIHEAV